MSELEKMKEIDLLSYIEDCTGTKSKILGEDQYRINPCPFCGHKNHFTIYTKTNSYTSFSGCIGGGTIIDFHKNYYNRTEKEAIQDLKQKFNAVLQTGGDIKKNKSENAFTTTTEAKHFHIDLTKNITEYYNTYHDKDKDSNNYFFNRGLSKNVIEKYKLLQVNPLKLVDADLLPALRNIEDWEYVLPVWEDGKVVNLILRRNDSKTNFGEKTYNLKNVDQNIFNIDYVKESGGYGVIFVTEGVFDALSIETLKYKAISLNSVQMANRLLKTIKENISSAKNYKYVICGDNDEAGISMNKKLIEGLNKLGIDAIDFNLREYKDINEFFVNDREKFRLEVDRATYEFREYVGFKYIDKIFMEDRERLRNYKKKGTGFKKLDKALDGGLYGGLYVVGGGSSMGKTTFIHQIGDTVAEAGNKVIFFSLEQSTRELVSKSISRESFKIDRFGGNAFTSNQVIHGEINETWKKALANYRETSKNIEIVEGNFDTTVSSIREKIIDHMDFYGKTNPLIIVDYLQILAPEKNLKAFDKRHMIDTNLTGLKRISRDFSIPIIVISSLNRESYSYAVEYKSFKESGNIEFTADVVVGLQYKAIDYISSIKNKTEQNNELKKESSKKPREIELTCLKQRSGEQTFTCNYKYYPNMNYFEEA